jgi:2-polyprenyl-3-methyl-5-hydroxy-6-metoxy-1,4-benzoquinol methylase
MNCEVCNQKKIIEVLNLLKQPLCDDLIPFSSNKKNKKYDIKIFFCRKCFTAHQKKKIKNKILFPKNYHYRSKLTNNVLIGMYDLFKSSQKYLGKINNLKVLDIGCNDGSLLNFFNKITKYTIGVEPTDAAKDAYKFHDIYQEYFNNKTVSKILKKYGKIDIIIFTNVFAHINNLNNLIANLRKLCHEKTTIIIENHYLNSILKKNQFDTFYHEHPRTYSLKSFLFIARKLNLFISKVQFPERYGGNIRVFLSRNKLSKKKIDSLLKKENNYLNQFKKIKINIKKWIKNKKLLIDKLNKKYGPLVGKAFPGRASIIINLLKLDRNNIKAIYEKDNSPKVNHYVPGTNIKILKEKYIFLENKHVPIINFAWHISSEIKAYLRKIKINNKIIDIISQKDFSS